MPTTKVVKIPVRIDEADEALKLIKYRALDKVMDESRYLGNMAIRYYVAYRLKGIPKVDFETGEPFNPDTRVYQMLGEARKFLPAGSMATLAKNYAAKEVKAADKNGAWTGKKSLPTFRSRILIFRSKGTSIEPFDDDGQRQFRVRISGFVKDWLSPELVAEVNQGVAVDVPNERQSLILASTFSWKDQGSAEVVGRIAAGEYKLADSQLKRLGKQLMLFLSFSFEPERVELDPAKVCGVDLGVVIPAVCALSTGPQRQYLGDGGDVNAARSKFRAQRRREQRRKGLYSKTRQWTRSEKEDNWIHTYYHALTRQVIKFCQRHGCGTIHMEDLTSLRQSQMDKEYERLLWVPSKFHDLLAYKAEEAGIRIVKVNPRYSSQRCSECGHVARENRATQKNFECVKCGMKSNADYNAARNLALADENAIKYGFGKGKVEELDELPM